MCAKFSVKADACHLVLMYCLLPLIEFKGIQKEKPE